MQSLSQIRSLLTERNLTPRKSLGQNFLIDHNLIRKLADAADLANSDLVLEVGPGTGALTEELLARGCHVIACELDPDLADLLRERITSTRFTLIEGDCLASKHRLSHALTRALAGRPFKLVANLPYAAATPLLLTLILDHPECSLMAVTIQREVAHRLVARPGSRDYGVISVLAQTLCQLHRIATLPPECFWPRPDVHSAMLAIRRRPSPPPVDPHALARIASALFANRRKQIARALLSLQVSPPTSIDPACRAENLTPEQFVALARLAP